MIIIQNLCQGDSVLFVGVHCHPIYHLVSYIWKTSLHAKTLNSIYSLTASTKRTTWQKTERKHQRQEVGPLWENHKGARDGSGTGCSTQNYPALERSQASLSQRGDGWVAAAGPGAPTRFLPRWARRWWLTHKTRKVKGKMLENNVYVSFSSRGHVLASMSCRALGWNCFNIIMSNSLFIW